MPVSLECWTDGTRDVEANEQETEGIDFYRSRVTKLVVAVR
jgi:hypothetical protein